MQIKNIHLVNYRGMEDLALDFGPGINLIIGDNGAGKSSLLKGLSVALGHLFSCFWPEEARTMEGQDIRMVSSRVGDVTESMEQFLPAAIGCTLDFCNEEYTYQQTRELNSSETSNFDAANKMKELVNDKDASLPLLSYQSAVRGFFNTTQEVKQPGGPVERRQGYADCLNVDCLNDQKVFDTVQNWCANMDYAEYKYRHEIEEYRLFKRIVSKFIKELEESETAPQVDFSPKLSRLVFSEGEKGYLIHNLSAGYQSILCLIMELAYRTVLLNPRLKDPGALEGVVLIDEIDIHLHPRWQWRILGALRATFPNVQFIIATHSPIVISSAEEAKLILMETPDIVKYLPDAYGYNIGDVVELTQGSMDMPQELRKWRQEIEGALDENDLQKAEKIVEAAEEKLGRDSVTSKRLREFFEVNKWIVEE
ncbi:MAG: AAA family ATPase [Fretibacterium sp.]|nr:AAA family ATPase [Fretibacterium sp.]